MDPSRLTAMIQAKACAGIDPVPALRFFALLAESVALVVAELESGDLPLEKSLALFEEGERAQIRVNIEDVCHSQRTLRPVHGCRKHGTTPFRVARDIVR